MIKNQNRQSLGTTSIPPVQQFLQAGRHCKIDVSCALEHADIELADLYRVDGRLSGEQFQHLLHYLIGHSKHPLFGLYSARFIQPDRFYILGQIGLHSTDLSQALKEAMPLEQLVGDMGVTEIREHHDGIRMIWHCQYSHPLVIPHLIDNVLASWVNFARFLLQDNQAKPRALQLQRDKPSSTEVKQYEQLFGCPVQFGQSDNAIIIDKALLSRPLPSGNLQRLQQLKISAGLRLTHIGDADKLQLKAARVIRQLLPQGKIQREQVGAHLHMAGRSLQRHLIKQGSSYQALLDQIRHEMADYWLTCSELSMEEIAVQLGFSDARVFFRAYKLWTGHTPGLTRKGGLAKIPEARSEYTESAATSKP
ncbi:AraC family transcriptional regulator [Shewanella atlantica]|uniref:AraC family transcriptional regulator n=1 Tax=Shewanella atlantica TaxID=271099 RepID=UPI0037357985